MSAYALNNLAVSVGKNYGDGVNTIKDAENADNAYKKRGYTTAKITNPVKSSFTDSRLKADILFLSGHGNNQVLSFGDEVNIVCQSGTTAYKNAVNIWSTARYQYIITFAGCSTAGGNNKDGTVNSNDTNITKRAVEQGASVAVGWTTSVSAGSHTNWLKRYNDALANGSSVAQAISKANSYIYLPGSGVKNVVYYGNGNIKLKSIATKSAYVDDYSELSNLNLPEREKLDDLKVAAISNMTTLNDNNDIVSYVYESTDERIVDIYYKYNGLATPF